MKKIIVIDDNLPYLLNNINFKYGGATIQSYSWLHGFNTHGFKVIVLSKNKISNNSNYSIETINAKNKIEYIFTIIKYYKLIKKYNPSFIYISIPWWTNFFVSLAAKILNKTIIQRISNDNFNVYQSKNFFKNYIFKVYMKSVNIFLCQNDIQKNKLLKVYPKSKIKKIYNPFLNNYTKKNTNKRTYIAWVGIFQEQKNMMALYDVVTKTPNLSYKIAGESHEKIDSNTELAIKKLKNSSNVDFVGLLSRDMVQGFLSQAYCLLNTSFYEGFSNTFLESFSVGTPVVTTFKTDPDMIINKNHLGYTVKSYPELPNAIFKAVNNKLDYNHIQNYLNSEHSPDFIVDKLNKILKND